jgi:hypothetical protein
MRNLDQPLALAYEQNRPRGFGNDRVHHGRRHRRAPSQSTFHNRILPRFCISFWRLRLRAAICVIKPTMLAVSVVKPGRMPEICNQQIEFQLWQWNPC